MADFNALKNPGFYNMDCMEALRAFPDNYFELALVDPPYGDGQGGDGSGRFGGMFAASIDGTATRRHRNAGTTASEVLLTSTSEQTQNKPHYNRFGGRLDRYKRQERTTPAQPTSPWNAGADNGQPSTETT